MTRGFAAAALAAVVLASCGRSSPEPAAPRSPSDRLEAILASEITPAQDSLFRSFQLEVGMVALPPLLSALAVDPAAPPLARANAVLRMGSLAMVDWTTYERTITDPDARVRGATLGVAGSFADDMPREAMPILALGLGDSVIGVQAKALQELRDRDLDLLRTWLRSEPAPGLRDIALQIIRSAEAWGAPLAPEPDGTLRRTAPAGVEIILRPDDVRPEQDLLIGTLAVAPPGAAPRVIADSVEAVAGVIPAVVDAEGRSVALETARRIEVHDLETGRVRVVDARGLAPRPLPFSTDFLYFRPFHEQRSATRALVYYEVLRASFGEVEPVVFDSIAVEIDMQRRGGLSPLRWVRVSDRGTHFTLDTDGLYEHPLPSPGMP